ncbi:MAG: epoxide hydrolase [Aliidongia sp.]
MTAVAPFSIAIDDATLAEIGERIRRYPWDDLPDAGGWSCGTDIAYLRNLARYWLDGYDWRAQEATLNRLPQFRVEIEGLPLHFVHVKGSGPNPLPLILSNGWPGSFYEFTDLVEPLAHPEQFGGRPEDSFDVVVPSLPGYGFSGRPPHPIGPRSTARLFNGLMTEALGYRSYLAQGGDWGSLVTGWLGYSHAESCRAIHLNMVGLRSPEMAPQSEAEKAWDAKYQAVFRGEGAYLQLQATKPQSLAFAMMDSPVGIAAWIIEKFAAWSHVPRDPHGAPALGVPLQQRPVADQHHDLSGRQELRDLDLDVSRLLRRAAEPYGTRHPSQRPNRRRRLPRPGLRPAAAQPGRTRLQRYALDRHAARRAFRRDGGAGSVRRRPTKICPDTALRNVSKPKR